MASKIFKDAMSKVSLESKERVKKYFKEIEQMENIKQSLLEHIADWIDSDAIKTEIQFEELEISEKDNEEIHIEMASAAFEVFNSKFKKNK